MEGHTLDVAPAGGKIARPARVLMISPILPMRSGNGLAMRMALFADALEAFHNSTAPSDWLESLVKAYVGDGFAADFYREIAELMDDETQSLVGDVLDDTGHAEFAVAHVRSAIESDPAVAGRLALWARRLVGEALVSAQRVAVDRDVLARLIVGGAGDLAAVGELLARLTQRHSERMESLGLQA